jgi:diguanylate cyclase (GGDEF)-like protein
MLDLDGFKLVNDSHGHLEGDLVLQIAARILEQNCRRSDIVARYGGDEFVILMPETSAEQARQIASKLRGWIAGERMLRNKNVTASFGIASFPVHGPNPEQLIQAADAAMYVSKRSGGNMVSDLESSPVAEPAHPENTTAC